MVDGFELNAIQHFLCRNYRSLFLCSLFCALLFLFYSRSSGIGPVLSSLQNNWVIMSQKKGLVLFDGQVSVYCSLVYMWWSETWRLTQIYVGTAIADQENNQNAHLYFLILEERRHFLCQCGSNRLLSSKRWGSNPVSVYISWQISSRGTLLLYDIELLQNPNYGASLAISYKCQ